MVSGICEDDCLKRMEMALFLAESYCEGDRVLQGEVRKAPLPCASSRKWK
jgi:hypothetical protein